MNTLAERLRYAMEVLPSKKIKGVELARAVNVKPPSVSDWLSGKSKSMEGENLLKVAKFLGVNPTWLATGNGKPKLEKETIELLKIENSSLPDIQNKSLRQLIDKLIILEQKDEVSPQLIKALTAVIDAFVNLEK